METVVLAVAPVMALVMALVVVLAFLWLRRSLVVVRVDGPSMAPTLADGDRVLVRRAGPGRVRVGPGGIRTGQLVLLAPSAVPGAVRPSSPGRLWLVKRLIAAPGEAVPVDLADLPAFAGRRTVPPGHLLVVGDNRAESYDSRQEGFIPGTRLRGIVVHHFDRPTGT